MYYIPPLLPRTTSASVRVHGQKNNRRPQQRPAISRRNQSLPSKHSCFTAAFTSCFATLLSRYRGYIPVYVSEHNACVGCLCGWGACVGRRRPVPPSAQCMLTHVNTCQPYLASPLEHRRIPCTTVVLVGWHAPPSPRPRPPVAC